VEKGITVGLGSDSVASSNSCDLIEESRTAAYLSRNRDPENGFLSGRQVIELATIGGARALRLGDQVGTLDVGKQADIAIVSLANEAQQPVHDVEAAIVFSSNARDVILTMVAGKIIYERPKG
jgi:5-methylthioadenosine/S-adenosylhomocysteine deaminase